MAGPAYTRVDSLEDDKDFEKLDALHMPSPHLWLSRLWPWVVHTIFFAISMATLLSGLYVRRSESQCAQLLSAYSPAIESIEYSYVKYNGSLKAPSPYRGEPSPDVDKAWTSITKGVPLFSIDEDVVARLRKNKDAIVQVPDDEGGGYLAGIEASHQLHCVNLLRMYTYFDYYKDIEPAFSDPPDILRDHLDHCLEMLRTNLMCAADAGIITFNWVEGHETPYPDFNTWHRCRTIDSVVGWVQERGLKWKARARPEGAVEIPDGSI